MNDEPTEPVPDPDDDARTARLQAREGEVRAYAFLTSLVDAATGTAEPMVGVGAVWAAQRFPREIVAYAWTLYAPWIITAVFNDHDPNDEFEAIPPTTPPDDAEHWYTTLLAFLAGRPELPGEQRDVIVRLARAIIDGRQGTVEHGDAPLEYTGSASWRETSGLRTDQINAGLAWLTRRGFIRHYEPGDAELDTLIEAAKTRILPDADPGLLLSVQCTIPAPGADLATTHVRAVRRIALDHLNSPGATIARPHLDPPTIAPADHRRRRGDAGNVSDIFSPPIRHMLGADADKVRGVCQEAYEAVKGMSVEEFAAYLEQLATLTSMHKVFAIVTGDAGQRGPCPGHVVLLQPAPTREHPERLALSIDGTVVGAVTGKHDVTVFTDPNGAPQLREQAFDMLSREFLASNRYEAPPAGAWDWLSGPDVVASVTAYCAGIERAGAGE